MNVMDVTTGGVTVLSKVVCKKQLLHGEIVFIRCYGIINRKEKSINIDGVIVLTRFWKVT